MIEFWTLGTYALRTPDGQEFVRLLARPKCLALLAYLAVSAYSHHVSRDTLLALFWPELDQAHARLALRQAIHVLRRELGRNVVLTHGSAMLGLAPAAIWCDAVAFTAAARAGEHVRALDLYRGDFLAGLFISGTPEFDHWLFRERARLRAQANASAWAVTDEMECAPAKAHAAFWARRAVELAPDDEHGVRRLLTLLDRAGDGAGALRAYEEFSQRLTSEYEIAPAPETTALANAIRSRARPPGEEAKPALHLVPPGPEATHAVP